jgi:acyl-CoA thioester hydrolase
VTTDIQSASDAGLGYGFLAPATAYFDDLDSFGILYNSHYAVLVERAWIMYWQQRRISFSEDWELLGDGFNVVKELQVRYESPIDRPGEYGVHIWVERLGRTSLTYGFRVCQADGSRTYAQGSRTVVRLDRKTLRPTEWTEGARSASEKLLRPATD